MTHPQTTMANIRTLERLIARADLVQVKHGVDDKPDRPDTPGLHIVVRGGNPKLREAVRKYYGGKAELPPLYEEGVVNLCEEGEFQLKFGDGYQHAEICIAKGDPSRAGEPGGQPTPQEPTTLPGGSVDPRFQRWLDQQVDAIRGRAEGLTYADALLWTAQGGEGRETEWTAIFDADKLEMGSPQRETVTTPGA